MLFNRWSNRNQFQESSRSFVDFFWVGSAIFFRFFRKLRDILTFSNSCVSGPRSGLLDLSAWQREFFWIFKTRYVMTRLFLCSQNFWNSLKSIIFEAFWFQSSPPTTWTAWRTKQMLFVILHSTFLSFFYCRNFFCLAKNGQVSDLYCFFSADFFSSQGKLSLHA